MLKHVLTFCAFILVSLSASQAKDDKWIDGIRFQTGETTQSLSFFTDRSDDTGGQSIISNSGNLENENPTSLFPIAIVLPENLMNTWSFRGAFIEFSDKTKTNDLSPSGDDSGTFRRQDSRSNTFLINNFFNDDDKLFIDGKDNWALTADIEVQMLFIGYYWGVFIPIGKSQRWLKMGLGLTAAYTEASVKLHLCEEYTISEEDDGKYGECTGKKEIDSASEKIYTFVPIGHFTLWERKTKSSIWSIISNTATFGGGEGGFRFNFKNHPNTIETFPTAKNLTFISYTYRF